MTDRITREDIAEVAAHIGVEPAALAAVLEVECGWPRRRGFDRAGRVRILYEPHIAHRLTRVRAPAKLRRLILDGLAYRRWGERKYPRSNAERWRQLERARAIVGDLAYNFASYGLPQIMGFNHRRAGYPSARAMVEDFQRGERQQLEALGRFLAASKSMIEALRRRQWARFARAYNGRAYKKNRYDVKLRSAYERWRKRPWPEVQVAAEAPPAPPAAASPPPPPADHPGESIPGPAAPPPPAAASSPTRRPGVVGLFIAALTALAAAGASIAGWLQQAWHWLQQIIGG